MATSPDSVDQPASGYGLVGGFGLSPRAAKIPAGGIVPRLHLSNLATPGAKVVDIIGDSTSTAGPTLANAVDPTQNIWGALQTAMLASNPDCTFTFNNRGIGGANWSNPMQTGTASGLMLPSWFTDPSKTWLSYVETDAPDVLFVLLGTNSPSSGQTAGSSVAVFIRQFMEVVNGWTKKPNIILITNKVANPAAGGTYLADQDNYKAMAAFLRTFARTSAAGYTSFSGLPYFGLIDIGRYYAQMVEGFDPYEQLLQEVTAARGMPGVLDIYPGNIIAQTSGGDFRMTVVFPGMGGTAMYAALGGNGLYITASDFIGNRLHFSLGAGGNWVTRYQLDGADAAPAQTGSSVSPAAGDVTLTLSCVGERITAIINGTTVLDVRGARLIGRFDVAMYAGVMPAVAVPFRVTEFYQGLCNPTEATMTPQQVYGSREMWQGGNGINHPTSAGSAILDRPVIEAANLAGPG